FLRIKRQQDGKRCLGHLSVLDGLSPVLGRLTLKWGTGFALKTRQHSLPPSISSAVRARILTARCVQMKSAIGATFCRSCPAESTNGCHDWPRRASLAQTPFSPAS